jgi:hypothetical protein
MFAAEAVGIGTWRGGGRPPVAFRPSIIRLEERVVLNGSMMPPSGHITDPVTLAAGIDSLAESLGLNLAGHYIDGHATQRQIASVLKVEAKLRTVINHLAAINGGNPDFERVLVSFRAHDAQLVSFASKLSNYLGHQ